MQRWIILAGLALLAAACSGGPASTGSGGSPPAARGSRSSVAFAHCMRSHGVPGYPDPGIDAQGRPLYQIHLPRTTPPRIQAAINDCERLEPAGYLLAWG